MIKYLAVYQIVDGQKNFVMKEALSTSDLKLIDRCTSSLAEFNRYKTLFQMVLHNYLDLTQYLEKEESKEKQDLDFIKNVGFHANRLTINYLSSAKLFIEHTEKKIKSTYGSDSEAFKTWKSATKQEFDSSFPYRFLYHLRNYTQHYGFPIGAVSNQITNKNITLFFVKDSLISNNYDWHKDVIRDLKEAPDKFPIFKVINEYNFCMARLYQTALKLIAKDLIAILEEYTEFLSSKDLKGAPHSITFKKLEDIRNPNKHTDLSPLPFNEVYECVKELEGYKVVKPARNN